MSLPKSIILLFMLFSGTLYAQTEEEIDSLKTALDQAAHDTTQIKLYRAISIAYGERNPEKSIYYIHKAIQLAEKNDYPKLAYLYLDQSYSYWEARKFDSLDISLNKLSTLNSGKDKSLEAVFRLFKGNQLSQRGEEKNSLEEYHKAITYGKEANNDKVVLQAVSNIAHTHIKLNNIKLALEYLAKGKVMAEKLNIPHSIAYIQSQWGHVLVMQNLYREALKRYDSAQKIYESMNSQAYLSFIKELRAEAYCQLKNYDSCRMLALEAMEHGRMLGEDNGSLAKNFMRYVSFFKEIDAPEVLLPYLDSALRIATKNRTTHTLIDVYFNQYELYAKLDKTDLALAALKNYSELKDSLVKTENTEELMKLETNYQIKAQENEIALLQANTKLNKIKFYGFILILTLVSVTIFILIYRKYKTAAKLRKKFQEIDQLKSRFLINLSHELRTPLSLIINPIQKKIEQSKMHDEKDELLIVQRNAIRLQRMIDQLLDLAKADSGKLKIRVEETDLNLLIGKTYSYFTQEAESKKINFELQVTDLPTGFIDQDMFEKIVTNLLYNAFKFTPPEGTIILQCHCRLNILNLSVKDSGIGIPKDEMENIFKPFYQVDTSSIRKFGGSGIGLSLCKELVDAHHGKITVQSIPDQGSEFTLSLPIDRESYRPDEISLSNHHLTQRSPIIQNPKNQTHFSVPITSPHEEKNERCILIVEDNPDMQLFLKNYFKDTYRILTASDGKEAWGKTLSLPPALVLSDLMMPEMDGLELCRKIKSHPLTAHIPVVILTAKTDETSHLQGLELGADAYFNKPFHAKALALTIKNLIDTSNKSMVYAESMPGPHEESMSVPPDTKILDQFTALIRSQYNDSNFGIDNITLSLGLSRSQLHKKIKNLTGKSPGEMLRIYRLEKAKALLLIPGAQISEIAYQVGHKNLSNFTKAFKEYVGVTPTAYAQAQKSPIEKPEYK